MPAIYYDSLTIGRCNINRSRGLMVAEQRLWRVSDGPDESLMMYG